MAQEKAKGGNAMERVAAFIVDKRNLFFLLLAIGMIFSVFSTKWIEVENDLKAYLPADSESRQGLDIMEEQFVTYGTAQVMVENVSMDAARRIYDGLKEIPGVQSVDYDEEEDYRNVSSLYTITFDYSETDDECLQALDSVQDYLSGQDYYVSTALGNSTADIIAQEVRVIMVLVAVVVVAVLLLTSQTYAELPVLLLTVRGKLASSPGSALCSAVSKLKSRTRFSSSGAAPSMAFQLPLPSRTSDIPAWVG